MRAIRIEKVTLNIGAGKDQAKLEKGIKLLKNITGIDPVTTTTSKRIPEWGIRPGLPIGCKMTLRKERAKQLLARFLVAKDNTLSEHQFDSNGNIAFGIQEYIDIQGVEYDHDIGIIGLEVCVTLERPGFRIKRRRICRRRIHHKHKISKEEAIDFMKQTFSVKIGEKA